MTNPTFGDKKSHGLNHLVYTLPETNIAPENGWLEYFLVSFWVKRPIFRGKLPVSFREEKNICFILELESPPTKQTLGKPNKAQRSCLNSAGRPGSSVVIDRRVVSHFLFPPMDGEDQKKTLNLFSKKKCIRFITTSMNL